MDGSLEAELASLCERGKISKAVKNRFISAAGGEPSAAVYGVCAELMRFFGECEKDSAEYGLVCGAVVGFVEKCGSELKGFERDVAVVCAYLSLTEKANTDGGGAFDKLEKHSKEFYESLENIRHRMPLFDAARSNENK